VLHPARCLALAAALGLGACATRETQSSRKAWQQAVERGEPGRSDGAAPSRGQTGVSGGSSSAWRDLASFTTSAAELLSLGPTTAPLAGLVDRLCAEPPDELEELAEGPAALRCRPRPPMAPLGHPLTMELARSTVGLAAVDLSERDSAALRDEALRQLAGACAHGWTKIPSRADNAHEEFHTCTARSGSMIVLGRFPRDQAAERWQFSLAVLGPG